MQNWRCNRNRFAETGVAAFECHVVNELKCRCSPVEFGSGYKPLTWFVNTLSDADFDRLFGDLSIDQGFLKVGISISPV